MKLEVGQFARLKSGYICKIININDFREPNMKYGVEANYLKDVMFIGDDDISKASHNIIDLIEENDLVTLTSKYCERDIYRVEGKFGEYISLDTLGDGTLIINNSKDIKSVVTYEQMEQMAYKVVE